MKLKSLLIAALAGLFFIGCTPQTQTSPQDEARIKRAIIGSWHSNAVYPTRDGLRIQSNSTDTFYRNGTLVSYETVGYINGQGKMVGKMAYTRYFSWKVKGNTVITTFRSCKSRVLRRAKNVKVEFVSDILKLACKYASKSSKKRSIHDTIRFIDTHKMVARNKILTR